MKMKTELPNGASTESCLRITVGPDGATRTEMGASPNERAIQMAEEFFRFSVEQKDTFQNHLDELTYESMQDEEES